MAEATASVPTHDKVFVERSSTRISDDQHQELLKSATQVEQFEGEQEPRFDNQIVTQTVKRRVHVPVEKEVKVPITTKKVETDFCTEIIRGKKMIPKKKYKDVTETVLETQEEVVHGFREKWVKVKEPTSEVVKTQVPVTRMRKVSYIDYEEEVIEKVVDVPQEVVREVEAFRTDKQIGTHIIEVEEDIQYEVRPIYLQAGERRIRETGEVVVHGLLSHGVEVSDVDHEADYQKRSAMHSEQQWFKAAAQPASYGEQRYESVSDYYRSAAGGDQQRYATGPSRAVQSLEADEQRRYEIASDLKRSVPYGEQHLYAESASRALQSMEAAEQKLYERHSDFERSSGGGEAKALPSRSTSNLRDSQSTSANVYSQRSYQTGGAAGWRTQGSRQYRSNIGNDDIQLSSTGLYSPRSNVGSGDIKLSSTGLYSQRANVGNGDIKLSSTGVYSQRSSGEKLARPEGWRSGDTAVKSRSLDEAATGLDWKPVSLANQRSLMGSNTH